MSNYTIIKRKIEEGWEVEWDGEIVYKDHDPVDGEWTAGAFADGLEMGITGSKKPLSHIQIEGWYNYLSAFSSYEEYK